jgi:preprotein translocase SecE subunit
MPKKLPPFAHPKKSRFKLFAEILSELKKVVWPSRQEAIRLTLIVLALSIALGLALGAVDYGFTQLAKLMFPG